MLPFTLVAPVRHYLDPPHRGGEGKLDPRWIINMLATYDLLAALHTGCASETLPSPNPPHRGGRGGGGVK